MSPDIVLAPGRAHRKQRTIARHGPSHVTDARARNKIADRVAQLVELRKRVPSISQANENS